MLTRAKRHASSVFRAAGDSQAKGEKEFGVFTGWNFEVQANARSAFCQDDEITPFGVVMKPDAWSRPITGWGDRRMDRNAAEAVLAGCRESTHETRRLHPRT